MSPRTQIPAVQGQACDITYSFYALKEVNDYVECNAQLESSLSTAHQ